MQERLICEEESQDLKTGDSRVAQRQSKLSCEVEFRDSLKLCSLLKEAYRVQTTSRFVLQGRMS